MHLDMHVARAGTLHGPLQASPVANRARSRIARDGALWTTTFIFSIQIRRHSAQPIKASRRGMASVKCWLLCGQGNGASRLLAIRSAEIKLKKRLGRGLELGSTLQKHITSDQSAA